MPCCIATVPNLYYPLLWADRLPPAVAECGRKLVVDHGNYDATVTLSVAKGLGPRRRDCSPPLRFGSLETSSFCALRRVLGP